MIVAHSTSPNPRKDQIFQMKIVSHNYNKAFSFFSFYNIFFYSQPAFVFHLLVDFRIIFLFLIKKDFDNFHEPSFVVFLCYICEKNLKKLIEKLNLLEDLKML